MDYTGKLMKERAEEIGQYINNIDGDSYVHDSRTFAAIQDAIIAGDTATIENVKLQWRGGIISIAHKFIYRTYLPFADIVNLGNEALINYMMRVPDERTFISFWGWNVEQAVLREIVQGET